MARFVNSGPNGEDIPKVALAKNDETGSVINPATEEQIGKIQETPSEFTLLRRLKDLLTEISLAPGANNIGGVELIDPENDLRKAIFDNVFQVPVSQVIEHYMIHKGLTF